MLKTLMEIEFRKDLLFYLNELLVDDFKFISRLSFEFLKKSSLKYKKNLFDKKFQVLAKVDEKKTKIKYLLLEISEFLLKNKEKLQINNIEKYH